MIIDQGVQNYRPLQYVGKFLARKVVTILLSLVTRFMRVQYIYT